MTLLRPDPGCIRACMATAAGNDGYLTWTRADPGPGPTSRLLVSLPASTEPTHDLDGALWVNNGQRPPTQSLTVDLYRVGRIRYGAALDPAIIVAALAAIGVLLIRMAQP